MNDQHLYNIQASIAVAARAAFFTAAGIIGNDITNATLNGDLMTPASTAAYISAHWYGLLVGLLLGAAGAFFYRLAASGQINAQAANGGTSNPAAAKPTVTTVTEGSLES